MELRVTSLKSARSINEASQGVVNVSKEKKNVNHLLLVRCPNELASVRRGLRCYRVWAGRVARPKNSLLGHVRLHVMRWLAHAHGSLNHLIPNGRTALVSLLSNLYVQRY